MTYVQPGRGEGRPAAQWRVAAYARLSREDGDKAESDSIQNQRRIMEDHLRYLREQGEQIASVEFYADDGYGGGTFDRPAYQRMLRDMEAGRINCVIFKDNSRLGRNYPELGHLMEEVFPQRGVRVISVLNRLDSVRDPQGYGSALLSFSNIVNDDYIRQLSLKIKCTLRMKRERGEYLGNFAPYGYVKSPADRHRLEIDPETAPVVRQIFRWYAEGESVRGIVRRLDGLGIPPPSARRPGGDRAAGWSDSTVRSMLKDEVYIGNLIQGRRKSISYRTKKTVPADIGEWTVFEDIHPALISQEQFRVVHDRFARRTRTGPRRETVYPLSGLVWCGHCGSPMSRCTSKGVSRWRCAARARDPGACRCPSVKEALVEEAVLEALQGEIRTLADREVLERALRRRMEEGDGGALREAKRQRERLEAAAFTLYDHFRRGIVDEAEYRRFQARYRAELEAQTRRIAWLAEARREAPETAAAGFLRCGALPGLDRLTLAHLVERVEIRDSTHMALYVRFSAPGDGPGVCSGAADV